VCGIVNRAAEKQKLAHAHTLLSALYVQKIDSCQRPCLCDGGTSYLVQKYVGVLISLWLFLFPVCSRTKRTFLGWVKEVRTTTSCVCVELRGEYVE
jgi:hypothetical protein